VISICWQTGCMGTTLRSPRQGSGFGGSLIRHGIAKVAAEWPASCRDELMPWK